MVNTCTHFGVAHDPDWQRHASSHWPAVQNSQGVAFKTACSWTRLRVLPFRRSRPKPKHFRTLGPLVLAFLAVGWSWLYLFLCLCAAAAFRPRFVMCFPTWTGVDTCFGYFYGTTWLVHMICISVPDVTYYTHVYTPITWTVPCRRDLADAQPLDPSCQLAFIITRIKYNVLHCLNLHR